MKEILGQELLHVWREQAHSQSSMPICVKTILTCNTIYDNSHAISFVRIDVVGCVKAMHRRPCNVVTGDREMLVPPPSGSERVGSIDH